MLYSSTKVATRRFVRHLENLGTATPLFNDIYFRSQVMSQLGGSTALCYVMTDWFNFRLQAIIHKSVERQLIKRLKKTVIV